MPNWTDNYIQLRGSKEDLDQLINDGIKREGDDAKEGDYSFGSWFPRPETYDKYDTTNYTPDKLRNMLGKRLHPWDETAPVVTEELIAEYAQAIEFQRKTYGAVGWYDWNVQNYGCKWDEPFFIHRESDTLATINVTTPWTAPNEFLYKMSNRYPNVEMEIDSHFEDGYNDWKIYNEGCECDCDLDEFQSELHDYLVKRVNEADTIDGEPVTEESRAQTLKAVEWYINSGYWSHESLESNWDNFEGNLNWIIPDFVLSEEDTTQA